MGWSDRWATTTRTPHRARAFSRDSARLAWMHLRDSGLLDTEGFVTHVLAQTLKEQHR